MIPGWILFADAVAQIAKEHGIIEREAARRIITGACTGALYTQGRTHQARGLPFAISPAAWGGMDPYSALSMLCTPNPGLEVQEGFLDAPMIHQVEIHGGSLDAWLAGNARPSFPIMQPVHARLENKPWVWMDLHQQPDAPSSRDEVTPAKSAGSEIRTLKKRGPKPSKSPKIIAEMRKMDPAELGNMKDVEMEVRFGAARSTCSDARKKVQSEIADK